MYFSNQFHGKHTEGGHTPCTAQFVAQAPASPRQRWNMSQFSTCVCSSKAERLLITSSPSFVVDKKQTSVTQRPAFRYSRGASGSLRCTLTVIASLSRLPQFLQSHCRPQHGLNVVLNPCRWVELCCPRDFSPGSRPPVATSSVLGPNVHYIIIKAPIRC